MTDFYQILQKEQFNKADLVTLLSAHGESQRLLLEHAAIVKKATVGNKVYFRGLIEFSNYCAKDCLYCGIRMSNRKIDRYNLRDEEIIEAAKFAQENDYASIVLQSGELSSAVSAERINKLLFKIHKATNNTLRVTLSLGEQTEDIYRMWFENGAHRYLLRIETTNEKLYQKIHPQDENHSYGKRMRCLEYLKKIGYQTGTGVMIGLPFQTNEDLADDLLFMRDFGIDMVGMGPYIEHSDTPLIEFKEKLLPLQERLSLALKMIATLRILRPKINIASATALQAIDKMGREKGIKAGANVIMPNITPGIYRDNYKLYENKPCTDENADDCANCLEVRIGMTGNMIGYGEWGDSQLYSDKQVEKH